MNIIRFFILIIFICTLSSCGEYFYHNEKSNFDKKYLLKRPSDFCSLDKKKSNLEIAGPSQDAVKIFKDLTISNNHFKKMSLVELNVAWALMQLNIRPDLVSPTSRLQILTKRFNRTKYYQFDLSNSKTPFLSGLNFLLKRNKSRLSLKDIATLLYRHLPRSIPITNEFAAFLSKNKEQLKNNDQFLHVYFKASQVMRRGESLPKANFKKIVSSLDTKERVKPISYLFKSSIDADSSIECNIDIGLYKKNIFLISPMQSPDAVPFGISSKNGNHIIMVSTNFYQEITPFKNSYTIKGNINGNPMMLCHIKNKKTLNEYTLVSSKGRDPGQHIFHLLNFQIQNSIDHVETQEYINFPRHLFLRNPDRLVYESGKGSEEQLRNFLSLDFPIYHKNQLGRVWIHIHNKSKNRSTLLIDHRSESALACIK